MLRSLVATLAAAALLLPALADAVTRDVRADADLRTTKRDGLRFEQRGTFRSTLGRGRITLESRVSTGRIRATFTIRIGSSTIRGRASGKIKVGGRLTYRGTASLTGVSGRYRNARARRLRFSGSAPIDGTSSTVSLRGRVTY